RKATSASVITTEHHSSLNTRKSLQQGIVKQNKGLRRRPTSRPTGWIP
ncbi:unnamed protein product, partial [Schistosoma curassoni]|uniref:Uncharacterized protein n=1 Tax=Schistosoma curassoni TaxID=6186 RepID=A0A183KHR3_9TREM